MPLDPKELTDIERNRERLRRIERRGAGLAAPSLLDEWEAEQETARAMQEAAEEAAQAVRDAERAAGSDLPLFAEGSA